MLPKGDVDKIVEMLASKGFVPKTRSWGGETNIVGKGAGSYTFTVRQSKDNPSLFYANLKKDDLVFSRENADWNELSGAINYAVSIIQENLGIQTVTQEVKPEVVPKVLPIAKTEYKASGFKQSWVLVLTSGVAIASIAFGLVTQSKQCLLQPVNGLQQQR
ncbi:hypothetical protein SD80_032390 [Scytonema tolypothrichoides VB-61278]|nr:hypothetical protein SD80_032390 [Scytonema tolypothrichoides VB-61278]